MDRTVKTTINGRERVLNYSVEVMLDMTEKFGSIQNALDIIGNDGKEAFETVKWFAVKMANDGELCRRDEGQDPIPMMNEKEISLRMRPIEYEELREAVTKAIVLGYKREIIDPDEEIDLGLAELEAKKVVAGE